MKMNGEELINASRAAVWAALNDPEALKQAIPGCQSVEKDGDDGFTATVKVKVGPVKATFKGKVTLSNIDEPNGYTITGEGKGGAAGFGKGGADITLSDSDDGTLLKYDVTASVGGKMAQIGSRLIDSTAQKLAKEFFTAFNELVSNAATSDQDIPIITEEVEKTPPLDPAVQTTNTSSAAPAAETTQASGWMRPGILVPATILLVLVIYFATRGA